MLVCIQAQKGIPWCSCREEPGLHSRKPCSTSAEESCCCSSRAEDSVHLECGLCSASNCRPSVWPIDAWEEEPCGQDGSCETPIWHCSSVKETCCLRFIPDAS